MDSVDQKLREMELIVGDRSMNIATAISELTRIAMELELTRKLWEIQRSFAQYLSWPTDLPTFTYEGVSEIRQHSKNVIQFSASSEIYLLEKLTHSFYTPDGSCYYNIYTLRDSKQKELFLAKSSPEELPSNADKYYPRKIESLITGEWIRNILKVYDSVCIAQKKMEVIRSERDEKMQQQKELEQKRKFGLQ
jgi:hypothetical protein